MVIQPKEPSSCPDRRLAPQKSRGDLLSTWLMASKMAVAWEMFFWLYRGEERAGVGSGEQGRVGWGEESRKQSGKWRAG